MRGPPTLFFIMAGLLAGLLPTSLNATEFPGSELLPLRFRYPWDWPLKEERGTLEPYEQVRLLGPRSAQGPYTTYIVIRRRPLAAADGMAMTLAAYIEQYLARLYPGSAMKRGLPRIVAGTPVQELTTSYAIPLRHRHLGGPRPAVAVITRTLWLQRGQDVYELVYSAEAHEYAKSMGIFEQVVASLQFF